MAVRVVSYNLLVPIYATEPGKYIRCAAEHLQTDYRWNLIQSQLQQEIELHENAVVCLQELSLSILPKLILFFRQLNYTFIHSLYGNRSNDYMGSGMAIPMSMQLSSISIVHVGDHLRSMSRTLEKEVSIFTRAWDLWQRVLGKSVSDSWKTAMEKRNVLLTLEVVIDSRPLLIGNYHMPCAYREPEVMAIHSSLVKDLMFQLADGKDFVLAGDFNLKPGDTNYRALIEKGHVGTALPESSTYQVSYRPNAEQVMKSAYLEKNGSEPVYTNFSDTLYSPKFCATLDYIFFSGQLTVQNVLELPDQPLGDSYPDKQHPSDHLMIAATFRV